MKQTIVIFLLSLLALSHAAGQSKEQKQLIKNLDGLISQKFNLASPGCAVLVASKGEVIYKKAFGSANLELNIPLKPEMVFSLASITKQFTAIAILQLEEQGKLLLKDSVQKYIPDFPSKQFSITIENLLTHTSGLKDYLQIGSAQPFMERWDFTPKELIDFFKDLPLEFEPGTRYKYSNSGYALLGYIIEKVSGKSYQTYMSENILKPLGLYNTYYDSQVDIIPNRVSGYYKSGNNYKNAAFWSPSIAYAAGGLLSNVEDLFLWHRGLLSYKIVKKETLDKAFTEYKLKNGDVTSYGYGWIIRTINGTRSIEHAGSRNGFLTNEIYFPKEDVFIALLFNSEDAPRDDLSIAIAGLALGVSLQQGIAIASDILDTYTGTYILTSDPKRKMTIEKGKEGLIARVSANESLPLLFQSATKFQFKNILDANCEFKKTDGKVTGFVVDQHGLYEWKKAE